MVWRLQKIRVASWLHSVVISITRERPQLVCWPVAKAWDSQDQRRRQGHGTHPGILQTYVSTHPIRISLRSTGQMCLSFRLDFYGFKLVNEKTGAVGRSSKEKCFERFDNLNHASHNYLRITVRNLDQTQSSPSALFSSVFWNVWENLIMSIWNFLFSKRFYTRLLSKVL